MRSRKACFDYMHKSNVFLLGLLSFITGVGIRSFFDVDIRFVLVCAIVGAFLIVCWFFERNKIFFGIAGIVFVAFGFGIMRFSWHETAKEEATVLTYAHGNTLTIRGMVEDAPDVREKNTRLVIRVAEVVPDKNEMPRAAEGKVLLFVNRYPVFQYGDELQARGILQLPEEFSGFDYPSYLAKEQIYSLMYYPDTTLISSHNGNGVKRLLFLSKQKFEQSIERMLPEPHAAFLKGILLGSRSSIPAWLLDAFQITGVTHIIALSGFNITIIADSISRVLRRASMSPQETFWISFTLIALFTVMVGASPSIVRASVMGVLVLFAMKEGRRYQGPNALTFAGAIMILHNPAILRFDVAFQLSFLATAGLLFVAPRLESTFKFLPELFSFRNNMVTTLAAQITVLPLLLYHFGSVSIVSPLSNILILSFMPLTMFFGFLSGVIGMIWTGGSIIAGGIVYALISYHIFVVTLLSAVPFGFLSF